MNTLEENHLCVKPLYSCCYYVLNPFQIIAMGREISLMFLYLNGHVLEHGGLFLVLKYSVILL